MEEGTGSKTIMETSRSSEGLLAGKCPDNILPQKCGLLSPVLKAYDQRVVSLMMMGSKARSTALIFACFAVEMHL